MLLRIVLHRYIFVRELELSRVVYGNIRIANSIVLIGVDGIDFV